MNYKKLIKGLLLAVMFLTIVSVGCYYALQWHYDLLEDGYNTGLRKGLLHTQDTGNITIEYQNQIIELPVLELCNNIIKQQLNSQGGN